jgi:hypothetical protein
MDGFFIFGEITVYQAKKGNRSQVNETIREAAQKLKEAYKPLPVKVVVHVHFVDSDFRIKDDKRAEAINRRPQGFGPKNGLRAAATP